MKYNEATSMEPHLLEEIRVLLDDTTVKYWTGVDNSIPKARLRGICTAIHAYTGEIWAVKPDEQKRYTLVNEDETECITPHKPYCAL